MTKVVELFTTVPTKFSLHFSEFCTNFYAFYKIQQIAYTSEYISFAPKPLERNEGSQLGPSTMGGGGLAGNPAAPVALPAGERLWLACMLT
jgi:hypothetical protein